MKHITTALARSAHTHASHRLSACSITPLSKLRSLSDSHQQTNPYTQTKKNLPCCTVIFPGRNARQSRRDQKEQGAHSRWKIRQLRTPAFTLCLRMNSLHSELVPADQNTFHRFRVRSSVSRFVLWSRETQIFQVIQLCIKLCLQCPTGPIYHVKL